MNINNSLFQAVRDGNLTQTKEIVTTYGLSYSKAWAMGYVLLRTSTKNKHTEITKFLITCGAKVNNNNKRRKLNDTPLHFAAMNGHKEIVEMLLNKGANIHAKNEYGGTALQAAVFRKQSDTIELLLDRGAIVDEKKNDGSTPLHTAVQRGNMKIIEILIKRGANVNAIANSYRKEGQTPLHLAAEKGDDRIVELLLKNNAQIDTKSKNGIAPIYIATLYGHEKVVSKLLDHGANVDTQDTSGKTILLVAVEQGSLKIVEHILKHNPDLKNKMNSSSINKAIYGSKGKYRLILDKLLQHGFTYNPDPKLLQTAIEKGYIQIVENCLKTSPNAKSVLINVPNKSSSLLHIAVKKKQYDITEMLIKYEANVNAIDDKEKTPMYYATENGDLKTLKLLLANKASVTNCQGLLINAVKRGNKEMVNLLLNHKVNIKDMDVLGRTALHFCALTEVDDCLDSILCLEIIRKFIKNGKVQVNAVKVQIAKILLAAGADVNAIAKDGKTTLHYACLKGYYNMVQLLFENNAKMFADESGALPIHLSAYSGDVDILKVLIGKGADVNAKTKDGWTAVHFATHEVQIEFLEYLLNNGANIDAKEENGSTALHIAAKSDYHDFVELLLKYGADIDATDDSGRTALYHAKKEGNDRVVRTLLEFGCDLKNPIAKKSFTPFESALMLGADIFSELFNHFGSDDDDDDDYYGSDYDCFDFDYDDYNESDDDEDFYDSDVDYFEHPGRSIFSSNQIAEMLQHHVIMMKAAKLPVEEEAPESNNATTSSMMHSVFKTKCEEEVEKLKSEKISDNTNVTFYDILSKPLDNVAFYARNPKIVEVLKTNDYKKKFPMYSGLLNGKIVRAFNRKDLLEQGYAFFSLLTDSHSIRLPYNCTETICSYLSDKDLRILGDVSKPNKYRSAMGEINREFTNAVNNGNLDRLRHLINRHGIYKSQAHGYNLLRESIRQRKGEITKLLLSSGSKVNSIRSKTIPSDTPLHFAIRNDDFEIVQMLLDHGADIDCPNRDGCSPLLTAIYEKNENIAELLLQKGPKIYSCKKGNSPCHVAVMNHLCNVTEKLLQMGANVDSRSKSYCIKEFTPLHCATANGDFEIVKILFKNGASVHSKTAQGLTPLHLACKSSNVKIIELLLTNNADINARTNNMLTPIYIAVENARQEAVRFLLERGVNINDEFENQKTILSCAVDKGLSAIVEDILQYSPVINTINKHSFRTVLRKTDGNYSGMIQSLLRYGFSLDHDDIYDTSLLHNAIKLGYTEIIQELIKLGLDLTCSKKENCNNLHIAVQNKQLEVAKLLLNHEADVNARDETGKAPLFYSIKNSDLNMTKLLISQGARIEKENCFILHIAVQNKQFELAQLLLNHGADVNARDKCNEPPVYYSIQNYDVAMTKLLVLKGASVQQNPKLLTLACTYEPDKSPIFHPIQNSYENKLLLLKAASIQRYSDQTCKEIIEILLENKVDIEATDSQGRTALHLIASSKYKKSFECNKPDDKIKTEIAKMLLNMGANVNAKTKDGSSALHLACLNEYTNIVEALLEFQADVDCVGKSSTPLHLAVHTENVTIVEMLLNKRPNVNCKKENGSTPLHIAVQKKYTDIVKMLLKNGANVDLRNKDGTSPFHLAAKTGNSDIIEMLMENKPNINSQDENGDTPLHYVATYFKDAVKILLKNDANVNLKNKNGMTPLHFAAARGDEIIIEMLLAKKANINSINENGNTALHIAVENRNRNTLKMLLQNGADVYSKNNNHATPLHMALYYTSMQCLETVSILLEHGSPIDSEDKDGNTPLHLAIDSQRSDFIKLLFDFGSDVNVSNKGNATPVDLAYREYSRPIYFEHCYDSDDESLDGYADRYESAKLIQKDVFKIVMIHLIKLKAANLYFGKKDVYQLFDDIDFIKSHEEECTKEIIELKLEKIANTNLNFYDILTKSTNSLVNYARNEDVQRVFKSSQFGNKFPMYGSIIERNFQKATQRSQLLETGHEFFKCYFEIPYECAEQLLKYLSNADLHNFIYI
ncbi:alpha-latrotoxin-Lhe1a-like [Episyrphus balteatus]|uniref:alpha-latrotoxin-Lhe1a-like n=1 Tax=Episyrphus balteatus TaxID=286459 RepID=UPI0024867ABC|nr:alpha-latrotoxin-Lhe1a-like [Episyrphus balteatus]